MDGDLADVDAVEALKTVPGWARRVCRNRQRLIDAFQPPGHHVQPGGKERPLPLDLVPRLLQRRRMARDRAGVAQRIKALEMFLADVYGSRRVPGRRIVLR